MALYLISYDINEKDAFEYDALWARLKQLGAERILYSEWILIDEVDRAGAIYKEIAPKTQKKDRLLVQEVTKDAQWDQLLIPDEIFRKFLQSARG
jgi:hypothetical protein